MVGKMRDPSPQITPHFTCCDSLYPAPLILPMPEGIVASECGTWIVTVHGNGSEVHRYGATYATYALYAVTILWGLAV